MNSYLLAFAFWVDSYGRIWDYHAKSSLFFKHCEGVVARAFISANGGGPVVL